MHKIRFGAAATALVAAGVLGNPAVALAAGSPSQFVSVVGAGGAVQLSQSQVSPGRVTFTVSSTSPAGTAVVMFAPKPGATVREVLVDVTEEFSSDLATAAQGTRDLVADATFYGLADARTGHPTVVSEVLSAGTYYLVDFNAITDLTPDVTTLTVRSGSGSVAADNAMGAGAVVDMTSADTFRSPASLPADGSILVRNVADTIHFFSLAPVRPGTTDADIQAAFDGTAEDNPFLPAPGVSMEPLSPGQQANLAYNVHPGTYVELCFIADDETGLPHAIMGMHKVVTVG